MKILLYGINFTPELTGIGKYTGEMAAWLAAAGHEVRVVTAPPYYPDWKVWPKYHASRYTHEVWEGVNVWRAPLWVPGKPSGLTRLLHLASFAVSSVPLMLRQVFWRPDLVWVVEPPLFCAPTAICIARLTGARAWLNIQDFEVDAAFALGLLRGKLARRLVTGLERWIMRRFDRVSTISNNMLALGLAKGVATDKLVLFPNWVDLESIQPLTAPSTYRAQLGLPDDAVIALYAGNMGGKQGLEIMAEAARLLAQNTATDDVDQPTATTQAHCNVHFVFCGNGAGKAELVRLAHGLPNVHFMDLQPLERLNELLGLADIHLLPQRADAADLVMPSKLTGMLASGRAVIATTNADTELGRALTNCGIITPPGDASALAAATIELASQPERRRAMGISGRQYAETHLGIDQVFHNFDDTVHALININ